MKKIVEQGLVVDTDNDTDFPVESTSGLLFLGLEARTLWLTETGDWVLEDVKLGEGHILKKVSAVEAAKALTKADTDLPDELARAVSLVDPLAS